MEFLKENQCFVYELSIETEDYIHDKWFYGHKITYPYMYFARSFNSTINHKVEIVYLMTVY